LIRGLVLSKYGTRAASTRQRFVQLRPYLELQGITIDIEPLLDNSYLDQIFSGGRRRLGAVASAYARRFKIVSACNDYDFVWVHCELFPYLPALAERLIERVTAPVIFDFDDAIFHQYDQHSSQVVRSLLSNKLAPLLARASVAFCGNAYLADYVKPFGCRAEVVPTTVDVDRYVRTCCRLDRFALDVAVLRKRYTPAEGACRGGQDQGSCHWGGAGNIRAISV
jgi:hypothetical protein